MSKRMDGHTIAVVGSDPQVVGALYDQTIFTVSHYPSLAQLPASNAPQAPHLIVIASAEEDELPSIEKQLQATVNTPYVLMVKTLNLSERIRALELGFADVICENQASAEISTRLMSQIYNSVADSQLRDRVASATSQAMSARKESTNLSNNIQFLLQAHHCDDIDQLGQAFFQTINEYNLSCSLQLRSQFGVKNMEANGMARPLESELLTQLVGAGRNYNFGKRCIINHGCISLLIKNMPEDEASAALIKNNTFTLLQGLDARVHAIDEHQLLQEENAALECMSDDVASAMKNVESSYGKIMLDILKIVENMADAVEQRIPGLLLNEEQEHYIVETIEGCVRDSNRIFSEGLHIDEHFGTLIEHMKEVLAKSKSLSSLEQTQGSQNYEAGEVHSH